MTKPNSLTVKNFGPINRADINLSPLTIFVGKNSSGKSFLSKLIHCVSNPFNHSSYKIPSDSLNYLIKNNATLFNDFEEKLNDYISLKPSIADDPFSYPMNDFITLLDEGFGKCYTKLIERELKNTWKTDLNNLNRMKKYSFEFTFNEITFANDSNKLINRNIKDRLTELINSINYSNPIGIKILSEKNFIKINVEYQLWIRMYGDENVSIARIIYALVVSKLIDELKSNSFYIPAGGEIFDDFNRYLSKEIYGITDSSNIQKEFLNNLLNINNGTQKGPYYNLACELEKSINKGEIKVKNNDLNDELIFIDENGLEFELNQVSSSIHELIPLIIYLKYYLNKNDTLILEEIENHLHPENQLILVNFIVKAINNGLNIILTTHSDYIIEKFNNLIRLGNSEKEAFDQLNYDKSHVINYQDIRIYNFKKNKDYSYTPNSIDINFTGFNDENFSQVIDELYHESDIMDKYKIR